MNLYVIHLSVNKFQSIEIIQRIFSYLRGITLEGNNRIIRKSSDVWKLDLSFKTNGSKNWNNNYKILALKNNMAYKTYEMQLKQSYIERHLKLQMHMQDKKE